MKTYASSHPTPEGCSGWFFPSRFELATIWFDAPDKFPGKPDISNEINLQIEKAGGTKLIGRYWSSLDSWQNAWAIGDGTTYAYTSQTEKHNVRAVLAF